MIYSTEISATDVIHYSEPKRWLWSLVVLFTLLPVLAAGLFLYTQNAWTLMLPLAVSYCVLPLMDVLAGTDKRNPPEALVSQLEADPHYNRLLIACIPAHILTLVVSAWLVGSQNFDWGLVILFAVLVGMYSGLSINIAHELGHKKSKRERFLSRVALAISGYGHFCIEHNLGHHRDVATPQDCASSKMGETLYAFMLREIPGALKRGWKEESNRLRRRGLNVWSLDNHILQSYLMTLLLQGTLIVMLGWPLLLFFLVHNVVAWFQLTCANYIEHYGLLREKKANGKYERCQPHHSWNANHFASNLMLFQLQRHSDHHAHPARSYQCLRSLEDLPELPSGYFAMFVVAYIPPLWFRVMDQRLLAVPHINGDLNKVNIDPKKEAQLRAKYV